MLTTRPKCGQEIEQNGFRSQELVTQKESLFHFQDEIRKMDAGVMYEETFFKQFQEDRHKRMDGTQIR